MIFFLKIWKFLSVLNCKPQHSISKFQIKLKNVLLVCCVYILLLIRLEIEWIWQCFVYLCTRRKNVFTVGRFQTRILYLQILIVVNLDFGNSAQKQGFVAGILMSGTILVQQILWFLFLENFFTNFLWIVSIQLLNAYRFLALCPTDFEV